MISLAFFFRCLKAIKILFLNVKLGVLTHFKYPVDFFLVAERFCGGVEVVDAYCDRAMFSNK
jgi:hypothetical protein